jgi:hypothetical protein
VFAGYGITAEPLRYDDYKNIDARGKIVLIFRHEPGHEDPLSIFQGEDVSKYTSLTAKMKNAMNHGALGVLVVNDPLYYNSLKPRGFPWPSLSKTIPRDALPLTLCTEGRDYSLPIVHVGESFITRIFGSVDSLKSLQRQIDKSLENKPIDLSGKFIKLHTPTISNQSTTQNVAALLRGSDPVLKDEVVIIGAHYDHVGYKKEHKAGEDFIFNGADDNASGTSAVLSLAEAFSKMPQRPRRSVLFIAFAAEEKGLFGSKHYTLDPLLPLSKTVAMINMDMIGRNDIDSLWLIGNIQSPDITAIVKKENRQEPFKLVYEKGGLLGGSDHYYFYKNGIPFMFLFSGFHSDYHKVTDNPDKINFQKAAKVTRLAFRTAWRISNDDRHYKLIMKE